MIMNVAIDGPAGAGKSTIARKLAEKLAFIYVDTGAMYRAIALYMLENQIDITNEECVAQACEKITIEIQYVEHEQQVLLNNRNVNHLIRTPEVSAIASKVSAIPIVREKLLDLQRQLAKKTDVIMDGRDIGTHVLPDAQVKIYLTASVSVRALRRFLEMKDKQMTCSLEEIEKEISERDMRDMSRAVAPLKKADDAILIDSSNMTIEEVIETMERLISQRR